MLNFLIDTSKGETPASVARKRALVAQLMGQTRAPQNVGEGLNALGDGIVAAVMNRRADKAEAAGRGEGSNAFASLFANMGGVDTLAPEMAGNSAVSPGSLPAQDYPSQRVSQAFGASSSDGGDVESYIRKAAAERGIDPEIAIRVAQSEGGMKDPFRQSDIVKNGVREQSYGPFQLYMGGGLGNKALEAGIDPRKDWQGGINFALDQAASGGWGPWYGAKKIGVTGMTGIGQRPTGQVASLDPMAGMPDPQMTPEQIAQSFAQSRPQMSPPVNPAMNGMAPPNPSRFAPDAQPVVPGIPGQQTMPLGPQASGLAAAQPPQPAQMPPMGQPAPQQPMQVAQAGQGQFPPAPPPPQNNRVQQLMQVMSNPWLSDQERQVAGMMLQQEMQKMDPMRQLEMEKTRLEMETLRNPKPKYDFLTGRDGSIFRTDNSGKMEQVYGGKPEQPTDVREYEYARQQGYKGNFTDWQIEQKRAGASQVNIDQKTEGAFDKKLAEKQAEAFDAMATEGMAANADIAVIGELETLLQGQGGTLSGIAGVAAKYGLGGEGMSDLQAAQALINKLVPTQRQPGSGTMSDRDVELFTRSLPNLWNTPGGNQKILSVMRGLAQYKQQQGQIAQAVMAGEMTRQEATGALRSLANPLAGFGNQKSGRIERNGYIIEQVD